MSMLRVIKGGPRIPVNKASKKFVSAYVTDTRLMGVLVLYIHWDMDLGDMNESLHQFFYVETTEIGIETYRSVYGNNQKNIVEIENAMMGGLGGKKKSISEREAFILLQKYADMTKRLGEALPGGIEEYGFILEKKIDCTAEEINDLFSKTCAEIISTNQLINYFLMRYISSDFIAADYLSNKPLERDILPNSKAQILCVNKTEQYLDDNGKRTYICESLIEDGMIYRILISEIRINGKLISSVEKLSDFAVSSTEAAMKLARPEFITVFEIMENVDTLEKYLDRMYPSALKKSTEMGRVYILFKNNNDHLKESFYRLNDDVKGILYITDEDQLVIGTYGLTQIQKLEKDIQFSPQGKQVVALAKYEFKESILYDFMQSDTGDFLHYMKFVSDYNPDE